MWLEWFMPLLPVMSLAVAAGFLCWIGFQYFDCEDDAL